MVFISITSDYNQSLIRYHVTWNSSWFSAGTDWTGSSDAGIVFSINFCISRLALYGLCGSISPSVGVVLSGSTLLSTLFSKNLSMLIELLDFEFSYGGFSCSSLCFFSKYSGDGSTYNKLLII